jgi:hypothetical protein
MKTIIAATVAFAALAVPGLAFAAGQNYYDPAEGEFVAGSLNVAPAAASDAGRYTQEATAWDPAEGEFVTTKVGSTPVVGTHDAQATTVVKRVWDPAEGEFVSVKIAN